MIAASHERTEDSMERISTNRGEFEYETRGSGEPLLLIHGAITAEAFHALLAQEALTSRYQVTHYYRRGFRDSPPHTGPFSIAQQADDALAVIRTLSDGRAHVAGHSYGGAILLQLALAAPEAVHTLSLLEPPLPVPSAESFFPKLAATAGKYEAGERAGAMDDFLELVLGPGEWKGPCAAHLPEGWHDRAIEDLDTFYQVEFPALAEAEQLTPEVAARITAPVLSVYGQNSARFFKEGDALIREWFSQAESFVVPNASHGLEFMNPRAVAEGLVAFLEKHPMRVLAPA
jgi:pimeloyl-ACP methyl ester carboxylesterase